ncbi:MAG: bile acid:sodium symporter family protein [Bacteroidales bacterium]
MNDLLTQLDAITIDFSASGVQTMNIVLALIMFGVALGIKFSSFKSILRSPRSLILGLIFQWLALPAFTFLLIYLFNDFLSPMVAMGMILVASCPGGNVSNFMTSFAKGNTELSVCMTAVSTVFTPLITPLNFSLWGRLYSQFVMESGLREVPVLEIAFMPMFEQVLILLGIPIVLGMLCTRFYPMVTKGLIKPLQVVSLLFFVVMVGVAFGNNFDLFTQYISLIFIIVLAHNLLALGIGYFGSRMFRLPMADSRSLTIEVGIQNSGLGLVLLFNPSIFPSEGCGGMLFITAWWGIWHIISGLTVATIFKLQDRYVSKENQSKQLAI